MKISFDIDGTIHGYGSGFHQIKELLKILVYCPDLEVIILTSRSEDTWKHSEELLIMLKEFDLTIQDVVFTNIEDKSEYIDKLNIDLHFDDNDYEVYKINTTCNGKAVLVGLDKYGKLLW